MKAAIFVQSNRIETYSDVMAAIKENFPRIKEFVFIFINDMDDEHFLLKVEKDLAMLDEYKLYVNARRVAKGKRKIDSLRKLNIKEFCVLDVTGISKENMAEILTMALRFGVPVCSLSWCDNIRRGDRKLVGRDCWRYFNAMKSPVIRKIYRIQKILENILKILVFGAGIIALIYVSNIIFGMHIVNESVISGLSLLLGASSLYLAYVTLNFYEESD